MQLLDDDMDELFRKAASDYPLNTGGSNWDALQGRLQQAEEDQQGSATGGLKGRWWFRLGLLLALTAILSILAVKGLYNGKRHTATPGAVAVNKSGGPVAGKAVDSREELSAGKTAANTTNENHTSGTVTNNEASASEETASSIASTTTKTTTDKNKYTPGPQQLITGVSNHQDTHERVVRGKGQKAADNAEGTIAKTVDRRNSEQLFVSGKTGNISAQTSTSKDVPTTNSSYPAARPGITAVNFSSFIIERVNGIAGNNTMPSTGIVHKNNGINIPAAAQENSAAVAMAKIKRDPAYLRKGLYYGLVISPDITTVKFQRFSTVGYNIGLIGGYRFGKKLAAETGILYERKYYYSTGKYFDAKNTPWPATMNLLNVDGWCNMYEIPVNVRFTFASGVKSSWYVNGGMSSYIMKRQGYDYTYEYNGYYATKYWGYKKTTKDWFSIVHLGVGYERPLGALGNLRVEPYVKIPASGIGVGNLPVTSVGINIGITRPIRFK